MFDVDTGGAVAKVQALTSTLATAKAAMSTLAASALGAFSVHAVASFIEEQIALGSALNDTSEKLGVSTDELQKFQMAAGLSGVGAEQAGMALGFLNKNLGEAIDGSKEQAKTFADLGINLAEVKAGTKSATDLLPGLADKFAGMGSDAERTAAAMKIFGKSGASLLPLLKSGSGELAKMSKEFEELGLGIDEDFIKKADEAGDRIDILKLGFRALKTRIAVELLPHITEGAKRISKWVATFIKLTRETHVVKEVIGAVGIAAVLTAGKVVYSWSKVLGLFPKGGSLIKNLFSMGEVGLIIAAFVLLALAIEDIVVMCQGGESIIGAFLDEMLGVEYRKELVDTLNNAWEAMAPAIEDLKPILKDLGKGFIEVIPYAIALVVDLMRAVLAGAVAIGAMGHALKQLLSGEKGSKIFDDLFSSSEKIFGKGDSWKGGLLSNSTTADLLAKPSVPATGVRQPTSMARGDTTIDVNVVGGPTNADTGAAVARGVQSGLAGSDRRAAAEALSRGTE